jgi:hypothetical protein
VTGSNGITTLPLGYRPAVWTCSVRCAVYLRARSNIDACLLALVGPGGWPSSWPVAPVVVDGGPEPQNAVPRGPRAALAGCAFRRPEASFFGSGEPTGAPGGSSRRRRRAQVIMRANGLKPHTGSLDSSIKARRTACLSPIAAGRAPSRA